MPAVSRDENIHPRLNRTGEDQVIGRVARHGLGQSLRRWDRLCRKIEEKLLDSSPVLRLETELPDEDPLQLDHYRLG